MHLFFINILNKHFQFCNWMVRPEYLNTSLIYTDKFCIQNLHLDSNFNLICLIFCIAVKNTTSLQITVLEEGLINCLWSKRKNMEKENRLIIFLLYYYSMFKVRFHHNFYITYNFSKIQCISNYFENHYWWIYRMTNQQSAV